MQKKKLNERKLARFTIKNDKLYKYVPTKQGLVLRYISQVNEGLYIIFGSAADIIAEYAIIDGMTVLIKRYATVYTPEEEE